VVFLGPYRLIPEEYPNQAMTTSSQILSYSSYHPVHYSVDIYSILFTEYEEITRRKQLIH
jgi:hypothetical protein